MEYLLREQAELATLGGSHILAYIDTVQTTADPALKGDQSRYTAPIACATISIIRRH
jgi:hypothetical protein